MKKQCKQLGWRLGRNLIQGERVGMCRRERLFGPKAKEFIKKH